MTTQEIPRSAGPVSVPCVACDAPPPAAPRFHKWGFPIDVCPRCGVGCTRVPAGFDPTRIYDRGYFTGGHRDGYADYPASERVLRREFRRTLSTLEKHVRGGRLLEVGCAYGFFLDEARRDFEVEGLELAPDAVDACRARGLDVRSEPIGDGALEGRAPYDAAVMLDVVEHLADPAAALAALHRALAPGGHLLLTTGDFGAPLARALGKSWRLLTPPQHLFFFTRDGLARLLAKSGFEIVAFDHPWKLVPLGLALFQLTRPLGVDLTRGFGSGVALPVNLFDAMQIVARRV